MHGDYGEEVITALCGSAVTGSIPVSPPEANTFPMSGKYLVYVGSKRDSNRRTDAMPAGIARRRGPECGVSRRAQTDMRAIPVSPP